MEHFVFVAASVYNNTLITHSITQQEHWRYQAQQSTMYQNDPSKKEI